MSATEATKKKVAAPVDLTFVELGAPTTNGMAFIYSTELAKKIRQPKLKKGTNNRGTYGLVGEAPWAPQVRDGKHDLPIESVSRVEYGTAAERAKAERDGIFETAEAFQKRNNDMKAKQREGAVRRQKILFDATVRHHAERIAEEKERYDRAKEDFDNRVGKKFTHRGVEQQSQLSELELERERLDRVVGREALVRSVVPKRHAATPEPSLEMLMNQKEYDMTKMPVPLRAMSVAGTTSGVKGEAESHVYPADRQRIRFNRLEAARLAAGRGGLVEGGWSESTSPLGTDKILPKEADTAKFEGMDSETRQRLEGSIAVRNQEFAWRKEKEQRRLQAHEEKIRKEEEAAQKAAADAARGVGPGTVGNRYNQLAKTYNALLSEAAGTGGPLGSIRVPKDLGIVKATTPEEMIAKEAQLLALLEAKRTQTKSQVPAGRPTATAVDNDDENNLTHHAIGGSHKRKALPLYEPRNNLGENLSAELDRISPNPAPEAVGPIAITVSRGVAVNAVPSANGTSPTPAKTRYMNSPPTRSLGGPRRVMQPTRKDIDRELRTVRDGGHLIKHHVPLVKTLSPERIQAAKAYGARSSAMSPVPAPKASMLM